jgi:hypothetical protein
MVSISTSVFLLHVGRELLTSVMNRWIVSGLFDVVLAQGS